MIKVGINGFGRIGRFVLRSAQNRIDINIVEEEIEQVKRTNLNCYKYGFVSKSGFKFNDDNLIILTLADIYKQF